MVYEAWELEHDTNLINTLRSAKIVEEDRGGDEIKISLGHLYGRVIFSDGVMYWAVIGSDAHGEKRVDQKDIDGSADYLRNYGRKAVRNELEKLANSVIADVTKRMET